MFASIGTPTALRNSVYCASSVTASAKIMSAPAATYACARSIAAANPSTGQRIGPRHDHKLLIGARIHGGLDAVDHLLGGHQFFARPVPAAFGAHLVFDMHRRRARLDHRPDRPRNVERAAPARVDIHQQGQRRSHP